MPPASYLSPEDVLLTIKHAGWGLRPVTSSCLLVYNNEAIYAFYPEMLVSTFLFIIKISFSDITLWCLLSCYSWGDWYILLPRDWRRCVERCSGSWSDSFHLLKYFDPIAIQRSYISSWHFQWSGLSGALHNWTIHSRIAYTVKPWLASIIRSGNMLVIPSTCI